jgi:hypothetical protein
MDNLLQAMQLIDKHSSNLPEGDYLELCKHLKNAYNQRSDPLYFFDYDTFSVLPVGTTPETIRYFHEYYFDKALSVDSDFLHGQITYLKKELIEAQPIRRITKSVRERVIEHYHMIHGVDTEHFPKRTLQTMCRSFVDAENQFRERYCESVKKRLEWLEEADDRLSEM